MIDYKFIKKLEIELTKHKVISFDIFDTLIKRDCGEPSRVFDYMQIKFGNIYNGFAKFRIEAEKRCRKKNIAQEIGIDDIYHELECMTGWLSNKLKEEELKFERLLCKRNKLICTIFKKAVDMGKYVIITSDMYLPKEFLENLLSNLGIVNYKKLYLSSAYKLTKARGTLFTKIIDDLKKERIITHAAEILHVGDNRKSDYLMSIKTGMHAFLIPQYMPTSYFNSINVNLSNLQKKEYYDLVSFISNNENDEFHFFEKVGYECLGPILYGFTHWIREEIYRHNISRVFFLSRDGQIMKKAWERIEYNIDTTYMYGSRRACIVPTLWMCQDFQEMLSSMFIPRIGTVEALLSKLGLNAKHYENTIKEKGLNIDEYYEYSLLFKREEFLALIKDIWVDIICNSKNEYEIIVKYLKSIGFNGKVALIDIGWHANMQKAIYKICKRAGIDVEIYGLYVGINPNTKGLENNWDLHKQERIYAKGYLFEKEKNESLFNYEKNFTAIFEMMFTANHGSVERFDKNHRPVLKSFEYAGSIEAVQSFKVINEIQEAALKYINDINILGHELISTDPKVVFNNLLSLGNFPNSELATNFGNLLVMDDKVCYMAKPHKLQFYMRNWRSFKQDYYSASWKIGFFKRLIGFNIPFYIFREIKRKLM